jgi:outer membrane protein OmpA-like peptidoglycan-associated protein
VSVSGVVTNQDGSEPIAKAELKFRDVKRKINLIVYTDSEGKYLVSLESNTEYTLNAYKPDYLNRSLTFETGQEENIDLPIKFSTLESGAIYILDGIQFAVNGNAIQDNSKDVLNFLSRTMNKHQKAILNLYVHTDSRGNDQYNLELSQSRAETVKAELIELGIPADRIKTYGYGEKYPLNHCTNGVLCNGNAHAMNRRIEISFQGL